MTPEQEPRHRESRSKRKFIRRQKAAARQDMVKVNQRIEINANLWRLAQVRRLLKPENPKLLVMNDMEKGIYRASLEIEVSWLELKCSVTTADEQKQRLSEYMNTLQNTMPDVYKMLVYVRLDEPSRAQQIHDKVFPPKPAGFPVKR